MPVQLDTHVPNERAHVSKVLDARAIMGLQDVRAGSAVNACKACGHIAIVRLQCQVTRQHGTTLLTECSVAVDKTMRDHEQRKPQY
jgi:hypothetical protein